VNVEKILIIGGSLIFFTLGGLHLYYTFFTEKFLPRNADLLPGMQNTSPRLTKDTTMWKAWVGFNASHSLGAMFFGAVNSVLAFSFFGAFENSIMIIVIDSLTILLYFFLAKNYWFRIPLTGIALSGLCFIVAFILILSR
jgi:hypothetical protein